jgi:DNA-directed RNA polymerase subunit RPC12/RpoP
MAKTSKPSLAETHPVLAAQADGWDPVEVTHGSNRVVSWRCTKGHTFRSAIGNRVRGQGCGVCAGKQVLEGFNDLATVNPELASEADGWDPSTVVAKSNKVLSWKCSQGHQWNAPVDRRTAGNGCPYCSGRRPIEGFNDLATVNPELASEADGWDPSTVLPSSHSLKQWKCSQGHQWNAPVDRRTAGNGCPVCSNYEILVGFNDLATVNPELASEADGWDPSTVVWGSKLRKEWKCKSDHKWIAVVVSRSRNGNGCPYCSGLYPIEGFNDLATVNPELASEADGWDPSTVSSGSSQKLSWKCGLGHTYLSTVTSRTAGNRCPYCSNRRILVGFNDLATVNPELAAQADGWDPTTVTTGNGKKKSWKCEFGHTWQTSPNTRTLFTLSTTGCPSCAKYGFDPNKKAWLYFLENYVLAMWQIGITNSPDQRLSKHAKGGWELIELRGPMEGDLAQDLESNCLKALVKRGAVLGHKAGIEKFDGYSEAWTKASLNVTSIKQILDWVYKDESK